jgi:hypothetical protein
MTVTTDTPAWADQAFQGAPAALPADAVVAVRIGALDFACSLRMGQPGDRLMVHPTGAMKLGAPPPAMEGWVYPPGFHVLTISDPSLLLSTKLRRGVFLGRRTQDPIDGVVQIVAAVASQLGLASEQALFYGASGSGFAACMTALRMGARAVAVNAQLDLYAARKSPHAEATRRLFHRDATFAQIAIRYPTRIRVREAYAQAVAAGRDPRLLIYQNRRDLIQHKGFYLPFCQALGLDPAGAVTPDGRIRVQQLDYAGGHKVRPAKAEALILGSLDFLYSS